MTRGTSAHLGCLGVPVIEIDRPQVVLGHPDYLAVVGEEEVGVSQDRRRYDRRIRKFDRERAAQSRGIAGALGIYRHERETRTIRSCPEHSFESQRRVVLGWFYEYLRQGESGSGHPEARGLSCRRRHLFLSRGVVPEQQVAQAIGVESKWAGEA